MSLTVSKEYCKSKLVFAHLFFFSALRPSGLPLRHQIALQHVPERATEVVQLVARRLAEMGRHDAAGQTWLAVDATREVCARVLPFFVVFSLLQIHVCVCVCVCVSLSSLYDCVCAV